MTHETLDRLLGEPRKKLIIQVYNEQILAENTELKREGEHLIRETKDLIQILPISQLFITHLKAY